MFHTLSDIGEKLNNANILWAVGASIVLNHYGLVEQPNDIDLLVDTKDIVKVDKILKDMGQKKMWEKTDKYSTECFYEYIINGYEVDVMAGLKINYNKGIFEYPFDQSAILEIKKINGINIPLTSLEDWYVLYQLIPNREAKMRLIENYFIEHGIQKPDLLKRALRGNLPVKIRERITEVLKR